MVKRFIAGAVCPKCGGQDSIRAERDELNRVMRRECVECGFENAIYDNAPAEIPTRVTPDDNVQAEPVNIITKH